MNCGYCRSLQSRWKTQNNIPTLEDASNTWITSEYVTLVHKKDKIKIKSKLGSYVLTPDAVTKIRIRILN